MSTIMPYFVILFTLRWKQNFALVAEIPKSQYKCLKTLILKRYYVRDVRIFYFLAF
jgi:hypothetical protein